MGTKFFSTCPTKCIELQANFWNMKFFGQDILKKNPVLAISAIANFLPPRAAAHPASPSGCSPEGCGGGKRGGVPPALLPRLDLCSPGKPRPRLTAPPPPPAPSRPAAAVPPNHAPPASRAQAALPCPPRPSPPQQWGRPNVSNQQNRRQDSPPRHSRTANRRSVPARRHTAPLRPISLFPLRPPCTGWPGQLASQAPRCAAPAHPCGPHQIPLPGCALRPTHPALPSSPRLNSGHA